MEIEADRNISKGEIIYENFPSSKNYYIIVTHRIIFKNNPKDCFYINLRPKDLKLSNEKNAFIDFLLPKNSQCINSNTKSLDLIRLIGNIVNMDKNDTKKCYKKLDSSLTVNNILYLIKFECERPSWDKYNPINNTVLSLEIMKNTIDKKREKAKEYLNLRKKNKKNVKLLFLLKFFCYLINLSFYYLKNLKIFIKY